MGQGTSTLFNDFALQSGEKIHELITGGSTFKAAIINNTKVAQKTDADPVIGDYTEVSGGTYATATLANQDFTLSGTIATFVGDAITWAQDAASGPTDCYQVILYLDGTAKNCILFIDLTADGGVTPLSLKTAPIGVNWGSGSREILKYSIPANA